MRIVPLTRSDVLAYCLYFFLVVLVASSNWVRGLSLQSYAEPLVGNAFEAYYALERSGQFLVGFFASRRRLLRDIRRLEVKNRSLRRRLYRARSAHRSLSVLRRYLHLPPSPSGELLPAEVVKRNLTEGERTLRINRGKQQGVRRGQVAVALDNDSWVLQGKVLTTSSHQSVVVLSSDPRFRIGVSVDGIPDRQFVARGWGGRGLRVDHFPRVLSVDPGVEVHTASASTVAPAGLLVGTVRGLTSESRVSSVGRRLWVDPPSAAGPSRPVWLLNLNS